MTPLDRRTLMLTALAAGATPAAGAPMTRCCPILELRQYTLHRDCRERFTALFEREFLESQEKLGAHVVGQFHDLDDPDRFVWVRGFESMESRLAALTGFYGGDLWKAKRTEANASIADSDNVLLLKPLQAGGGFEASERDRGAAAGVIVGEIHYVAPELMGDFSALFDARIRPHLETLGATTLTTLVTETSANTFPRLPIRAGDHVLIWFARFPDEKAERAFVQARRVQSGWRDGMADAVLPALMRKPERVRLTPQRRSRLR